MGEIVNLRRVRRRKQRETVALEAAENRVRFGRTAAERDEEAQRKATLERALDGAKIPSEGALRPRNGVDGEGAGKHLVDRPLEADGERR